MKVVIASWNPSKVKKIKRFLSGVPIEITSLSREIEDIEETALTFEGNAALKVEAVRCHFPEDIIIGEDSGLTIDALEGFPGVKTARFSPGSDAERAQVLIEMLAHVPLSKSSAQFNSCVIVSFPNGESAECHGFMPGWISNSDNAEIRGYGDIFLLSNGKVLSEIDDSPFNHQHQALFQAKQHILEWLKR
ncbi:non-canonical purine NTP pyrophosphatase [Bacillus mesophilum]|nr:non-canonical purine NTP pyrophosphatase [Bacillus mesophilum]